MNEKRLIVAAASKRHLHDKQSDFAYWQSQSLSARMAALESIRAEFHTWRYGAQPRLQRVYSISKQKQR